MQRVLGIDPGLRITGYGVVALAPDALEPSLVEAGVIPLNGGESVELRLGQLYEDLCELIDEQRPDTAVVEKLYSHYRHPRTAILMAHARGVILLCMQQRSIPVDHLASTQIKKALTGYGRASKQQMQMAVQHHFRLPQVPEPPDVADAIAMAVVSARRMALTQMSGK